MLEYISVHKAFDAPVLAGVDLQIAVGETMSIVGHSGTGKSVLLKTTIGLITPDRGDVRIDGKSVYYSDRATVERLAQGFVEALEVFIADCESPGVSRAPSGTPPGEVPASQAPYEAPSSNDGMIGRSWPRSRELAHRMPVPLGP